MERPDLSKSLDSETFLSFYYLKEELADFLKANGLPTSGSKSELTERVSHFLDTGEIPKKTAPKKKATPRSDIIDESAIIEDNFVCSEKHRAFFKDRIGSSFTFNTAFQKWLKSNAGKTYKEAIEAYNQILEERSQRKQPIDSQFEYNAYIRAFFADNKGKTLEDAIKCWKYKKSIKGHNRYESSDLTALK